MGSSLKVSVLACNYPPEAEAEDPVDAFSIAIPGSPGEDYPIFSAPPETSFRCDRYIEGYIEGYSIHEEVAAAEVRLKVRR